MMDKKDTLSDLITLVKVFDVNYITDEDSEKLSGLDANQEDGVGQAVRQLLLPHFNCYTDAAKARLLNSLRSVLADPKEDFIRLFDRVELAFDRPVTNRRNFMQVLLRSIESSEK